MAPLSSTHHPPALPTETSAVFCMLKSLIRPIPPSVHSASVFSTIPHLLETKTRHMDATSQLWRWKCFHRSGNNSSSKSLWMLDASSQPLLLRLLQSPTLCPVGPHVSGCMCPRTDFCNSAQEVSGSRKTGPPDHTKEAPVTEWERGGAADHHSIPGLPLPPTVSGSQPRRRIHTTAAAVARQEAAKWHRRLLRKHT